MIETLATAKNLRVSITKSNNPRLVGLTGILGDPKLITDVPTLPGLNIKLQEPVASIKLDDECQPTDGPRFNDVINVFKADEYEVIDEYGTPNPIVPVVFRKYKSGDFKGQIIALMPTLLSDDGNNCDCYEQTGQHGGANYFVTISKSTPATSEEYASLKAEMENGPYHYRLRVYLKATGEHHRIRHAEMNRIRSEMKKYA